MKNMTISRIAEACEGVLYGMEYVTDADREAEGVVLDSRILKAGDVFIATPGEKVDGHKFIPSVFEKGALAVLCEQLPNPLPGPCILVQDSFRALKKVALFYREQLNLKVVGITGSVGKTSTKEFVAGVLSAKYKVWKTQGNFNNEVGLPLTVLQLREEHQIAVLEMGISDFGEMHRLSEIAKPDICVLTNIGQCHLEFLGDRDGVLRAKTEIFDFMNPKGWIVVNGDDDKLATLKETKGEQLITFGRNTENDLYALHEISNGLLGSRIDMAGALTLEDVEITLPGEHMVLNALAAASVAKLLGLTAEEIREGMGKVETVSGRSHIIALKDLVVIDDCYNANPVSMRSALDLLQTAKGRRVAVLGDMFELGEEENMLHCDVGAYAADKADCLILVGTLARYMYEGAVGRISSSGGKMEVSGEAEEAATSLLCENGRKIEVIYLPQKEALYTRLSAILKPQDTLLLKASHGMGFASIVNWLEKNF